MTITLIIIIVTAAVSFYAFSNQTLTDKLIFAPTAVTTKTNGTGFCAVLLYMPILLTWRLTCYRFIILGQG